MTRFSGARNGPAVTPTPLDRYRSSILKSIIDEAGEAGAEINRLYRVIEEQARTLATQPPADGDHAPDAIQSISADEIGRYAAIMLKVAAPHLPAEYVAERCSEMNGRVFCDPRGLDNIVLRGPNAEVNRFIRLVSESVETGRHVARVLGLNSREALAEKLQVDVTFDMNYLDNGAFRHGVDSVALAREQTREPLHRGMDAS